VLSPLGSDRLVVQPTAQPIGS